MPEAAPVLHVVIELESAVREKSEAVAPQITEAVRATVARMMETLGIPGMPNVELRAATGPGKWLRLRVGGRLCRYPDVLLSQARAYVTGTAPDPDLDAVQIQSWFADSLNQIQETAMQAMGLVCESILECQPAVLMQDEQAEAYVRRLEESGNRLHDGTLDRPLLTRALRAAVNARCSVANPELVRRTPGSAPDSLDEFTERLIRAMRAHVVEIRAAADLYESLAAAGREQEMLSFLREGIYEELGVFYPEVRLVVDGDMRPGAFRFRINSLHTLPLLSPGPGKILVNETVERLKLKSVAATGALNVATNQPAAIVDAREKEELEAAGLTTWDEWGFVVLALASELRRNAVCFVDSEFARLQLRSLARVYPKLVEVSMREIGLELLTRVLKGLVQERVSVRDLKIILERLLDARYAREAQCRYLVLDYRLSVCERSMFPMSNDPEWTLEFVRQGMKAQLGHKFTRGTGTLVVYLLDKEIERMLEFGGGEDGLPDEDDTTRILQAIHAEAAHLPPTAQRPLLLTAGAARGKLWRLVAAEIPATSALSYEEVARDLNIQPIARILV